MGSFQNEWDFLGNNNKNDNNKEYLNKPQNLNSGFNDFNVFENINSISPRQRQLDDGSSSSNNGNGDINNNNNNNIINKDKNGNIIHTLTPKDTLQGLSIKYGVKIDDIKRLNKIWSNDTLFLKKVLTIPKSENDNEVNNSNGNGNSSSPNKPINIGNNNENGELDNMFPEFEKMGKSFGTTPPKKLPEYNSFPNNNNNNNTDNTNNWRSTPISTFSLSPVVTSLDQKTQNQFSLLDEEFNPL